MIHLTRSRVGIIKITGGINLSADSNFPPEEFFQLVRLVSHRGLPGEESGGYITEYFE